MLWIRRRRRSGRTYVHQKCLAPLLLTVKNISFEKCSAWYMDFNKTCRDFATANSLLHFFISFGQARKFWNDYNYNFYLKVGIN